MESGGRRKEPNNIVELTLYFPNDLKNKLDSYSTSSAPDREPVYLSLLVRGIRSDYAREYLNLRLLNRELKRTKQYADYAEDNATLLNFVESLRTENDGLKQILIAKGLLRKISERGSR